MCYTTYPCQHNFNNCLMSSTRILEFIKNSGINLENLSDEQKQFIKHMQYKGN